MLVSRSQVCLMAAVVIACDARSLRRARVPEIDARRAAAGRTPSPALLRFLKLEKNGDNYAWTLR